MGMSEGYLSKGESLPSSVEMDPSPHEASTINRTGSRLQDSIDETHSSDLFGATSDVSAGEKGLKEGNESTSDPEKRPTRGAKRRSAESKGKLTHGKEGKRDLHKGDDKSKKSTSTSSSDRLR